VSEQTPGGVFAGVVARPVAVSMVFLAAIVFGWVSYNRLPIELMPDISYPTLTVRTTFEGAAPEEIEDQVSQKIEESLATLDGLVSLESRSRAGASDVVLGFDWSSDMSAASQSIREQLQTTWLPDGADRPLLLRYDPSLEPFLRLALSYDPDALDLPPEDALYLLREVAEEDLKRHLEGLAGVAAVRVRGGLEREIRVSVREDWLAARRLDMDAVRNVLSAENINLAGGSILQGDTEYLVRTLNEYGSLEELREIKIRRNGDGVLVPLTDVAVVKEMPRERTVVAHLDGAEAVELEVFKEADANVVAVAATVKSSLFGTELGFTQEDVDAMDDSPWKEGMQEQLDSAGGLVKLLPEGIRIELLDNQAEFIEMAISNLRSAVLLGGVLAVGILFAFLRDFRATGVIGLAIPVSVILGFAPLYLWDVSLNLMSLGGLALGVGMLVDNAVVVLEAIQRHVDEGVPRRDAAVLGASEVATAVVASTLTTVAVFAPIAFVEGVGGQLFGDLSLAVVGSLVASLVVALFLVPTLAALGGEWTGETVDERPLGRAAFAVSRASAAASRDADLAELSGAWKALLPWVWLRWVATVALMGSLALAEWLAAVVGRWSWKATKFVAGFVATGLMVFANAFHVVYGRFATSYDRAAERVVRRPVGVVAAAAVVFVVAIQAGMGLGAELLPEVHQGRFTARVALPVGTPLSETNRVVSALEREVSEHPEVAAVYTTIGADQRVDAEADDGEHSARIRVQLEPGGNLTLREDAVMADLRELFDGQAQLDVRFERPALFSFRSPLEIVVFADGLDTLRTVGDAATAELAALGSLSDVESSLQRGHPELRIRYDRERLARFGLDTRTVATKVRDRIQGVEATRIQRGNQRLDLRVQLDVTQRSSLEDLRRLNINPDVQPPIPLDAVATIEDSVGPSEIRRVDQRRAVVLSANLAGFDLSTAVGEVTSAMRRVPMSSDVTWTLGGQAQEMQASLASLQFAMLLAVFLVYVIMASTFEHLVHPFVILFTVPLSFVGVVLGLAVWGMPISVVASIGVIVLAGVVVNNAIVLVDAINRLREDMPRLQAIREAARIRLRPILITTATTVLGLLPLAFGQGAGAEVQRPLAVTVIGGLSVSTLLTLGVIPAVYAIVTRSRAEARVPATDAEPAK
jgi:HAE1 family hydrophobic/amphiphilic exporter-1